MSVGAKPGACKHGHAIDHAFPNGQIWRRCVVCGTQWHSTNMIGASALAIKKSTAPVPPHYLKLKGTASASSHKYPNWTYEEWGKLKLENFYDAENLIKQWNAMAEANGKPERYKLPLHCDVCYHCCSETFAGGMCWSCKLEESEKTVKPKPEWIKPTGKVVDNNKKPIFAVRTKGEIWEIAKTLSPMGSRQWGYMGSAKDPYIITQYFMKRDGSTTVDGWACGCMDFTRRTPRTHCKHILNIMLQEGIVPEGVGGSASNKKALGALANVNDEQLEAFKKWQREQAEAGEKKAEAGDASLNLFGSTGRKFR